mgnify:CR=1 FL=1
MQTTTGARTDTNDRRGHFLSCDSRDYAKDHKMAWNLNELAAFRKYVEIGAKLQPIDMAHALQ